MIEDVTVYQLSVCEGNFRMIGDDLVNSYHLLLCCLDLVFGNALLCANRKDLINLTFRGGALVCVFTLNGTLVIYMNFTAGVFLFCICCKQSM